MRIAPLDSGANAKAIAAILASEFARELRDRRRKGDPRDSGELGKTEAALSASARQMARLRAKREGS